MRLNKKIIVLFISLFFVFAIPSYAKSTSFFDQAQKYINGDCAKQKIANDAAVLCYLYKRSAEQDTALNNMRSTFSLIPDIMTALHYEVSSNSATTEMLNQKIIDLENKQSLPPLNFSFFNGSIGTGATSPIIDAKSYSKITFTFLCKAAGLSLQVSNDQSSWLEQYASNADTCSKGGSVTLSTAGRYYSVNASATPSNTGTVNAIAQFSN
jgi:hypothetical protein